MYILVLNAWSSSLKYQVIDMQTKTVLVKGNVEKIWEKDSFLEYEVDGKKEHIDQPTKDHAEALSFLLKAWSLRLEAIEAIGHRVVHGGDYFSAPVSIDDGVIEKIRLCYDLAPLHNPANLACIFACQTLFPKIPQVAVFDTAFHQSMTPEHYLYALPYEYYQKYKVRRYGFHWTSHEYVFKKLVETLKGWKVETLKGLPAGRQGWNVEAFKVITCHIGNGASVTAIQDGKVVETSMGMTPMEWLMMGTRSGTIDPGVITFLMKQEDMSAQEIEDMLNKKSGLLGVSQLSSDMRDILDGWKQWDERCTLVLHMYVDSIVKYIWSYVALMNGVDAIVLTAGVLERSKDVRKLLVDKLARLGISLDEKANDCSAEERVISTLDSQVLVKVIPTNEELMIAQETYNLVHDKMIKW